MHLDAPEDEEPDGTFQPLVALGLPTVCAEGSSLCHRILPGLLPLPIAHRIAQHQDGIDVPSFPAHASPFKACFDHELIGAFYAA